MKWMSAILTRCNANVTCFICAWDLNRPWNLVTVNKPPPKIKLGGYLPHCGEVCGEYAIVEEVWGRTDRPLYVQVGGHTIINVSLHAHAAVTNGFIFERIDVVHGMLATCLHGAALH
jgi:hypothetical protein